MGNNKEILKELRDIKKLLICALIRSGASSEVLGIALGVDGSTIRRITPVSKLSSKRNN